MGYQETIKKLCDAGLNPGKTIAQTKKETGKELGITVTLSLRDKNPR